LPGKFYQQKYINLSSIGAILRKQKPPANAGGWLSDVAMIIH
jgi:hypothetical protein